MADLISVLKQIEGSKVIAAAISKDRYAAIDLSSTNPTLLNIDCNNAISFEKYIEDYVRQKSAVVAYGGYNEERNLYKRSIVFNDNNTEERNIHIGLDLWIKAGTPILAALDGVVHSYKYNDNLGDYGPTIILEHRFENTLFYTLYGHLSLESIANLKIGAPFKKGQKLATLGNSDVNGNYAPHLHFQVIKDLEHNFGDYPGVSSKNKLDFYLENCPDPNLLLKIC